MSFLAGVQQSSPMAISSFKSPIQACKHKIKPEIPELDKYRPYFSWVNADIIRDTFKHTTQWGASVGTFPVKKHLKSRNPALNVPRGHEAVTTEIVFSDTPAVDSGVKQAQLFVGKESLVPDIYQMRSYKQFVNTLEVPVLWTSYSVIQPNMRSPTRSRTYSGHTTSVTGSLNLTTRFKIELSGGTEPSRNGPTPLGIELVLLLIAGCLDSNMYAICSTTLYKLIWWPSSSPGFIWCNP